MGQMNAALIIKTFGGLTVEKDGAACTGAAAQRKHLALFALLAAAGERGVSRDKLVAYLWPERDAESARHLLNQACYALRRELDQSELFLATADLLRLNPAVVSSDIQAFQQALERTDLTRAVSLYAGPFLDGFYLPEAGEFERWVEAERARATKRVCEALRELATGAAAREDQDAAEWWRRLVALDPLSADAVLGLMTALAAVGERAQAVYHGQAHCMLVQRELDAAPASAVTQLIEKLRNRSGDRPPFSRGPAHGTPASGTAPAAPRLPRRALVAAATVVAAGALAALALAIARRQPVAAPTSVAVLYFDNLSADSGVAYFADGLTDELIVRLGAIGPLAVKSRAAVRPYRRAATSDPASLGRALGVAYLITGSVRREGDRLRVNVELVRASSGDRVWGEQYDRRRNDLLAVQEEIARAVAGAVGDRLRP
jgi:TolB-like protein/DNA-binding SARP family transcriptional activator